MARPIEEVVATMLHEMVHLWNLKNNIQDCSRGQTYHNKKFKEKAVEIGLNCEHHDKYGWTITTASEKIIDYIIGKGWTELDMTDGLDYSQFFGTGNGNNGINKGKPGRSTPTKTTKNNSHKYVCPHCGMIVRATRIVNVKCGDCDLQMIESI